MNYFIIKNNVQQGPYSEEDMEAMYIANRLPGVTPVWYEGAENWMTFSATPIFETFKSSTRRTFFLMFLPIYMVPLPFYLPFIIYIIFMTMRGGWGEIISAAKRLKQSDNKKYEIFLLVGGLYPIIWIFVAIVSVTIISISCKSDSATNTALICVDLLYYGIWVGLAIYSGVWKDFLPAAKKIYWAYKQARLLTKQQKTAS